MPESSDLASDLEFVKALALEAAAVAKQRCQSVTPQEKANLSYVTDLDQDLEQFIRRRLGDRFPDDLLTGEEYDAAGGTGPRRWSIDPIDGTGNLVHGLPLWAISIGLIIAGEPALGVIVIPPLNELFWAVKGAGAWLDRHRLQCHDAREFHNQDNVCVGTNALRAVDPRTLPGRLRDLGSACCEQTFVAANRLQATTLLGEHAHDIAAGIVIATEAGCQIATIKGERLTPAEMVRRTPISVPTFVAPPRRLMRSWLRPDCFGSGIVRGQLSVAGDARPVADGQATTDFPLMFAPGKLGVCSISRGWLEECDEQDKCSSIEGALMQHEFAPTKLGLAHYLRIYDHYLTPLKMEPVRILELGVAAGESLLYWRDFFPYGCIVGLDIHPVAIDDPTGRVRFFEGEQQDRACLDRIAVATAPDGFDIIIDDASHYGQLTRISFWHLLRHHLKPGGFYFIEDWGCGYFRSWPDGKQYTPAPPEPTWLERTADSIRKLPLMQTSDFRRRVAGFIRRKVGKRVIRSHQHGMVGFVKTLVDECGALDMTDDVLGGRGPKRPSSIEWMRVSVGMCVVKKAGASPSPF